MSTPLKKRKILPNETENSRGDGATKKSVIFRGNTRLEDVEYQTKLQKAWESNAEFVDETAKLQSLPFRHGEIKTFVENPEFLDEFVEKFASFQFHEKASDLFQFRQSDDLKSFVDPYVYKIMEYLSTKMISTLKSVTGLPLNDEIDLFLSDYRQTDFLLCHDDELESRRIAFILYLSKEWSPEFGGNLDLYSAKEDVHPDKVVRTVTPEFNKFVFFEVGATSFHQVSEVIKPNVSRLALSGWFYGDPLPRPNIEIPHDNGCLLKDSILENKEIMKQFCSEDYLTPDIYADINEQLTEESQVLIPGFFQGSVYTAICSDIVEQDVSKSVFNQVGPPNISNYQETCRGPPQKCKDSASGATYPHNLEGLSRLFYSKEFLQFMEKITEFPFTSCEETRVTSSLRKFTHGSYSLLKSGGAKHTGQPESKLQDDSENVDIDEEEPEYVDIIYYFSSKWDEQWGGLTIYSAEDGEQLITIPPEGNCLAVVVRSPSVNSYVNYVNCLAKDEVYFAYTMTFAFNGKL